MNTIKFSSRVMKTLKFSLVLRTRENTDVFITLDDNIYGIHSKRVNILYLFYKFCMFRGMNILSRETTLLEMFPF